jgi:hypothetical protein
MTKGGCLLFFRAGWRVSSKPSVMGKSLVLTLLSYIYLNNNHITIQLKCGCIYPKNYVVVKAISRVLFVKWPT